MSRSSAVLRPSKAYDDKPSLERIEESKGYPEFCKDGKAIRDIGKYGVSYLDDALGGISPGELVLLGAPTGIGKTSLTLDICVSNAKAGRKPFMAALEAYAGEMEDREKFKEYVKHYFADTGRKPTASPINMGSFIKGELLTVFEPYRQMVMETVRNTFNGFDVAYKKENFTVRDLLALKDQAIARGSDFIAVDHAHFFSYEVNEESSALTEIVRACRDITQVDGIPMILVAQLRKRDKSSKSPVPDGDDFHGTSNLTRIPNTNIILSPGAYDPETQIAETYVNITKARFAEDVKYFVAKVPFSTKQRKYGSKYQLGKMVGDKWQELSPEKLPQWAINAARSS